VPLLAAGTGVSRTSCFVRSASVPRSDLPRFAPVLSFGLRFYASIGRRFLPAIKLLSARARVSEPRVHVRHGLAV